MFKLFACGWTQITSLTTDRDKTLTTEILENKQFQRTTVEEHYSVVSEPGSTYLGHITHENGSSFDIFNNIYEYVTTALLDDFSNLAVLGCDGTVENTGVFNGLILRLELKQQRPIQWIICSDINFSLQQSCSANLLTCNKFDTAKVRA
ncbi:hypothetical protein AVEN_157517-1 [Araneus ventricosus]|uniref:DUF4371 domain-containing protein n=1 Tax=Araneus ventricosus TaxID=182803 RepID=A0A4Y2U5Q5_ARAVE|nr:hypothetical protein AVEN_157517-1 [Araneus ventricosus]